MRVVSSLFLARLTSGPDLVRYLHQVIEVDRPTKHLEWIRLSELGGGQQ